MSYRPHGAWRTMEVLEELALVAVGSWLTPRSLVVSLDTSIGTSGRYNPRVAVGRLIFLKLSLPRYGVGRSPAPCCSLLMRIHS
jgi:hypothetical protein